MAGIPPEGARAERSGRWHSRRWWWGHHDLRDACGSYTEPDNIGGECKREDGRQAERRTARKLRAEAAADARARKARGKLRKVGGTREELRESTYLAQHAQEQRAEAAGASRSNRTERRAFFGSKLAHADSRAERRQTATAEADLETRRRRAQEAAEREEYEARAKAHPWFRERKLTPAQQRRAQAEARAAGW